MDVPEIRQSVVGFLHRMVDSIGLDMIPFLPFALTLLLAKTGVGEMLENLRMLNQLTQKFKVCLPSLPYFVG